MTITKDWKTIIGFMFFFAAGALFVLALNTRSSSESTGTPTADDGPLLAQCAPTGSTTTPTSTAATPSLATVAAPGRLMGASESSSGSNNDILAVSGSQNTTQGTDGGFGDIGMQFQNVTLDAPITNVHVSNEGSNNQTAINVGGTNGVTAAQGSGSNMTAPQQPSTPPSGQTSPAATGVGSSPATASQAPSSDGSSTSTPSSDTGSSSPTPTGSTSTSTSA
jgi:hypothetical protein